MDGPVLGDHARVGDLADGVLRVARAARGAAQAGPVRRVRLRPAREHRAVPGVWDGDQAEDDRGARAPHPFPQNLTAISWRPLLSGRERTTSQSWPGALCIWMRQS